jgi:hypothetical protein
MDGDPLFRHLDDPIEACPWFHAGSEIAPWAAALRTGVPRGGSARREEIDGAPVGPDGIRVLSSRFTNLLHLAGGRRRPAGHPRDQCERHPAERGWFITTPPPSRNR